MSEEFIVAEDLDFAWSNFGHPNTFSQVTRGAASQPSSTDLLPMMRSNKNSLL